MRDAHPLRTLLLRDGIVPCVIVALLLDCAFLFERVRNLQRVFDMHTAQVAQHAALQWISRANAAPEQVLLREVLAAEASPDLLRVELRIDGVVRASAGSLAAVPTQSAAGFANLPRDVAGADAQHAQLAVYRSRDALRADLRRSCFGAAFVALGVVLAGWFSLLRLAARTERPLAAVEAALAGLVDGGNAPVSLRADSRETAMLYARIAGVGERLREIAARAQADRRATSLQSLASLRESQAALRSKSHFLGEFGHHLRQPLQAMQLSVAALHAEPQGPQRPLLESMQRNIDGMRVLLDGLLELSQLDAGFVRVRACTFVAADFLESELAPLRVQAERDGVRLVLHGAAHLCRTDPELLGRLLRHLTANALSHAPGGRVLVAVRRRGARIEVRDSGAGIPLLDQRRIFDEFVRLGDESARGCRGFGLGLAIASRLAALLGSRIELRSMPGRGSTFAFDLPPGARRCPADP